MAKKPKNPKLSRAEFAQSITHSNLSEYLKQTEGYRELAKELGSKKLQKLLKAHIKSGLKLLKWAKKYPLNSYQNPLHGQGPMGADHLDQTTT